MTARSYFAGRYVAQEARKEMRAADREYGSLDESLATIEAVCTIAQASLLPLRSLAFDLPMPPTVNRSWHALPGGGKALTAEHRAFRTNVISNVRRNLRNEVRQTPPLDGRLELRVDLYYANKRVTDIDNRVKPLQDALKHARVYHDDSQIDVLIVRRIIRSGEESCHVVLREIGT